MSATSIGATIPDVAHHRASIDGTQIHYVAAGTSGSPVLLVHGFPETWWVFHKVIPLLSRQHQVFAVDIRGFGDSAAATNDFDSETAGSDLCALIAKLDVGPLHLAGQDISGPTTFRVAATHPELIRSYTAIETGLPSFGLELLADVTHGGAWHIGVLAAPGIPEMLLAGREHAFIADYSVASLCKTARAFRKADIDELVRSYSRPNAWKGAAGLYRSMLREAEEIKKLASKKLTMPVLAVAGASGELTANTFRQVAKTVHVVSMDGVGHYVAMEAPDRLVDALESFYRDADTAAI